MPYIEVENAPPVCATARGDDIDAVTKAVNLRMAGLGWLRSTMLALFWRLTRWLGIEPCARGQRCTGLHREKLAPERSCCYSHRRLPPMP